jgi:hypothetical protein
MGMEFKDTTALQNPSVLILHAPNSNNKIIRNSTETSRNPTRIDNLEFLAKKYTIFCQRNPK